MAVKAKHLLKWVISQADHLAVITDKESAGKWIPSNGLVHNPESIKQVAELYAGCIAGAIPKEHYMVKIFSAGFLQVKIQKEKPIVVPDDILKEHLDEKSFHEYKENNSKILSITVTGVKPESACNCGSGCC